jgi:hypothetical protein
MVYTIRGFVSPEVANTDRREEKRREERIEQSENGRATRKEECSNQEIVRGSSRQLWKS